MDRHQTLTKIRKLLRLAHSSNVHEAAAAAAAARAMIERHRIDASILRVDRDEPDPPIGTSRERPLLQGRRIERWRTALAATVAELSSCRMCSERRGEIRSLFVVGHADDIEDVYLFYAHLADEIERLAVAHARGQGRSFHASFRLGAVITIGERLSGARDEAQHSVRRRERGPQHAVRVETGLSRLHGRNDAVRAWIAANLDLKRERGRTARVDQEGFYSGRAAGHAVALARAPQVTEGYPPDRSPVVASDC